MNDQILNSLVESYKEKGISTHELLRDPLFLNLPIEKQVEALQAYAGVLAQGSRIASPGKVLSRAVLSGAIAGVFAGLPLAMGYHSPRTRAALSLGAGIIGAITGAVSVKLMHNSERNRFETTNKYLIQLAQRPDVPTAVKVLDANRKYEPRTINSIVKKMASPEQALIERAVNVVGKAKEEEYKKLDSTE